MSVKLTLSIKSLSTKRVKSPSLRREEEGMTISRRDSVVRKNQSSRKRPKSPRRSLSNLSVVNAREKDSYASEEPSLSNLMIRRKHNNKNLGIIFLNLIC